MLSTARRNAELPNLRISQRRWINGLRDTAGSLVGISATALDQWGLRQRGISGVWRHRGIDGRAFEAVYDGRRLPAAVSDEQRQYVTAGSLSMQPPPLSERSTLIRRLTGR